MEAKTVGGFMTVGMDRNINLSCRFPRVACDACTIFCMSQKMTIVRVRKISL